LYTAFGNVEPVGKRFLLALDVSGSMTGGKVAGVPGLSPRDASAALALVTVATETNVEVVGFYAGSGGFRERGRGRFAGHADGLTPLPLSPRQRLERRGADGVRPAVRRHGLCAADAVRTGPAAGRSTRS
jgi:60 kDa SS-A/Ro ribonucleoprotein